VTEERNFTICTLHQTLLEWTNKGCWDEQDV